MLEQLEYLVPAPYSHCPGGRPRYFPAVSETASLS